MEDQLRLSQQELIRMQGEMRTTRQELDVAQQRLAAQPPTQAFSPLIDTRMLTKPRLFSGREEDWGTFARVTRAYRGALDPRLYAEVKAAALEAGAVLNVCKQPDQQYRS